MQCTQKNDAHLEGVMIGYKRELFQLFKTYFIEFNHAADSLQGREGSFRERCKTDDVAMLAFLQPWPAKYLKSAFCVCSAMLCSREGMGDVRFVQSEYLATQIELANKEFQVPVLMGISMYDGPDSPAYHVLRTGRKPLTEGVPRQSGKPRIVPLCRGSVRVFWKPPLITPADHQTLTYRIAWRPGGSQSLSFRQYVEYPCDNCMQYEDITKEDGSIITVAKEEMTNIVVGLTSDLPFEFRVTATNVLGVGIWSDSSEPIILPNARKAPKMPGLVNLRDMTGVKILRESAVMALQDWDVEKAVSSNPVNSLTQLTPRDVNGLRSNECTRGRVLPLSINPREGWRSDLKGKMNPSLAAEVNSVDFLRQRHTIRGYDGKYIKSVSDTDDGKMAISLTVGEDNSNWKVSLTENDFPSISNDIEQNESNVTAEGSRVNEQQVDDQDDCTMDGIRFVEESTDLNQNDDKNQKDENDRFQDDEENEDDNADSPEVEASVDDNGSTFRDEEEEDLNSQNEEKLIDGVNLEDENSIFDGPLGLKQGSVNQFDDFSLVTNSLVAGDSNYENEANYNNTSSILNDLPSMDFAEYLQDDCFLDAKDVVENLGKPNRRHVHDLFLRSAYESSSCGAEPIYTTSKPSESSVSGVKCEDYIFYSANAIKVNVTLCIPPLMNLNGDDPRQNIIEADPYMRNPYPISALHFSDNPMNIKLDGRRPTAGAINDMKRRLKQKLDDNLARKSFYGGTWIPYFRKNCLRNHYWLPNDKFCSDHMALCAEFEFLDSYLSVEWK